VATTTTATTNFSATVVADVKRRVLDNLRAKYAHIAPGNPIQASYVRGTNSFVYVTYADLAAATTALTEGTPPTDNALAISTESFSATQIGATFAISDLAALQSPHNLASIASERLADNAAKTADTLVREIIVAGASVFYAGSATSRATVAVSHLLTGALVKRMVEELQTANIPTFDNGNYRAIIHTRQAGDLQRDTSTAGYVDIFKANPMAENLTSLRTASYAGVDFIVTQAAKVFATAGASSANVFAGLFFGPEAFAMNDLQSLNAYFVPAGGDHNDPIAQKIIVGWKQAFGAKLLTGPGAKLMRAETGATNG
jgi:N4-gp56 family major capsid protein